MGFPKVLLFGLCGYTALTTATYCDDATSSVKLLQDDFYNSNTGLWKNKKGQDMWWQSGNFVELLARYGQLEVSFKPSITAILANTYAKSPNLAGSSRWKNGFYDDMGWWAMGWIATYDLTGDIKYLHAAEDIFHDMTGGWSTPCGGGIWWDKAHSYIAAISNELFFSTAAHLANRVSSATNQTLYRDWARKEWDWFDKMGFINANHLINDGLNTTTCKNNGHQTFTYNQGVLLGGLGELSKASDDSALIQRALALFNASSTILSPQGILTEPGRVHSDLDDTAAEFKGAYIRGLAALNHIAPQKSIGDYLRKNADAVWSHARNSQGLLEDKWQGNSTNADAVTHASGIDVIVAAAEAQK